MCMDFSAQSYARFLTTLIVCAILSGTSAQAVRQFVLPETSTYRRSGFVSVGSNGQMVITWAVPASLKSHDVFVASSTDGGDTWTEGVLVANMRMSMLSLQRGPRTVRTSGGTLVCCYVDSKSGDSYPGVYVARSDDNGKSWTDGRLIQQGETSGFQDFVSIAAMPNGGVVACYLAHRSGSEGTHVWSVVSNDAGLSWSEPLRVTSDVFGGLACECCQTSVATSRTGTIAISFRANLDNHRDIHVAYSNDGGLSYSTPMRVQSVSWIIPGCPATGPSAMFDDSLALHITWRDYRVNKSHIWYARLDPGQVNTPDNIPVSDGITELGEWPSLSCSPDGRQAYIMYEGYDGIFFAFSDTRTLKFATTMVDSMAVEGASTGSVWSPARSAPFIIWDSKRSSTGLRDIATKRDIPLSIGGYNGFRPVLISQHWEGWITLDLSVYRSGSPITAYNTRGQALPIRVLSSDSTVRVKAVLTGSEIVFYCVGDVCVAIVNYVR